MHSNRPQGQEARQEEKRGGGGWDLRKRREKMCRVLFPAPVLVKSFHSTVNIFHLHARKHTQTWRHSHGPGNKRRDMKDAKRSLSGARFGKAYSSGSGKIGPSSCILQYPQGLSLMTLRASELGSRNKVTELCSYCRHSWNYLCKFQRGCEPVNTNCE